MHYKTKDAWTYALIIIMAFVWTSLIGFVAAPAGWPPAVIAILVLVAFVTIPVIPYMVMGWIDDVVRDKRKVKQLREKQIAETNAYNKMYFELPEDMNSAERDAAVRAAQVETQRIDTINMIVAKREASLVTFKTAKRELATYYRQLRKLGYDVRNLGYADPADVPKKQEAPEEEAK